jgi:hypothetical protein
MLKLFQALYHHFRRNIRDGPQQFRKSLRVSAQPGNDHHRPAPLEKLQQLVRIRFI